MHESYAPPMAIDIPDEETLRATLGVGPEISVVPFHLVRRGAFDLLSAQSGRDRVNAGEVAFCPNAMPHRMAFGKGTRVVPLQDLLADKGLPHADASTATELICGVFQLRSEPLNPLMAALPRVMKVKVAGPDVSPLLDHAVAMLGIEVAKGRASFIASRLLEIFFAEAIRAFGSWEGAAIPGWFRALNDPKIGHALSRLHERPGADWTVAALAGTVALSPSRFAVRFREAMGQSAMSYVSNWRMTVACQRLRESDARLAEIAVAVGYQDAASFSRVFKTLVGHGPARWRSLNRA